MPGPVQKKKLALGEVIKFADEQPTKVERIKYLRDNSSTYLLELINYVYNPKIKWLLPPGAPPFKKVDGELGTLIYALVSNFRKVRIFVSTGPYPKLNQAKREQLFIDFLGSLHPIDSDLLLHAKEKKLPGKNIDQKVVSEAFPELAKNWK